jgi:GTPase SAR1 family protein
MDQLPSNEALALLVEQKGHQGAAWYALRNGLRSIAYLGNSPVKVMWPNQYLWYTFSIIRGNVLAFLWLNDAFKQPGGTNLVVEPLDWCSDISQDVIEFIGGDLSYIAVDIAELGEEQDSTALNIAANVAAAAACAASLANDTLNERGIVNSMPQGDNVIDTLGAVGDYYYLTKFADQLNEFAQQPLWLDANEPAIYSGTDSNTQALKQALINDLNSISLDFIADDLNKLWAGEHPGEHLNNYLKEISEAELQSADDLRQLIHGQAQTEDNYAVRALLIGPGGAGKTTLSQLLSKGKATGSAKPTLGINYQNHQALDLSVHHNLISDGEHKSRLDKLQLYLWDFGGQAIFHSLHNAFMHENCVYILVVDSRHEQAPDEWLHQIAQVTHNRGKVLLVTNWFDGINKPQNRQRLIRQFPQLLNDHSFYDFSCISPQGGGFCDFLNQLIGECLHSQRQIFKQTSQAIGLVQARFENAHFISNRQLTRLLRQQFGDASHDEVDGLRLKLHEFGRFISVDCDNQQLCLKPEWVIDKAYQLLYDQRVQLQKGQIVLDDAMAVIEQTEQDKTQQLGRKVLGFMVQQKVCIALEDDEDNYHAPQRYFLPDAAPVNEPLLVQQLLKGSSLRLSMFYELPYLPIGLRGKLVSQLMQNHYVDINPESEVWRDGMMIHLLGSSDCAVLEYQPRQQRIYLTLLGEDKGIANLLDIIDKELETASGRTLIGQPVLDSQSKGAGVNLVQQQQSKIENVYHLSHCRFEVKGLLHFADNSTDNSINNSTDNSVNVQNSQITNSAVGHGAKNAADNVDSYTANDLDKSPPEQDQDQDPDYNQDRSR